MIIVTIFFLSLILFIILCWLICIRHKRINKKDNKGNIIISGADCEWITFEKGKDKKIHTYWCKSDGTKEEIKITK